MLKALNGAYGNVEDEENYVRGNAVVVLLYQIAEAGRVDPQHKRSVTWRGKHLIFNTHSNATTPT